VILASLETENGNYFGSGASLTSEYAVERAILEAVQGYHNYSFMNSEAPLFGLTRWAETSLYQRCYLEAGHFGFRGGSVLVEFGDVKSLCFPGCDIKDNLNILVKHLNDQGFEPFWRTIIDEGIAVVQVSVPRFDRFHLVTQGVPVAPSARGRSQLSRSKSESFAT
jgi:ribosomal protein S12 methylthiotransferase accessory factor